MEIKKSSPHCQLVKGVFGDCRLSDYGIRTDLCGYMRQVVLAALLCAFVVSLVFVFVLYPVGDFIGWVAAMVFNLQLIAPSVGSLLICLYAIAGSMFGLVALVNHLSKKIPKREPKPPGLIGSWISAKKHKFCPSITFVDQPPLSAC